jgi:hypothetical protein
MTFCAPIDPGARTRPPKSITSIPTNCYADQHRIDGIPDSPESAPRRPSGSIDSIRSIGRNSQGNRLDGIRTLRQVSRGWTVPGSWSKSKEPRNTRKKRNDGRSDHQKSVERESNRKEVIHRTAKDAKSAKVEVGRLAAVSSSFVSFAVHYFRLSASSAYSVVLYFCCDPVSTCSVAVDTRATHSRFCRSLT